MRKFLCGLPFVCLLGCDGEVKTFYVDRSVYKEMYVTCLAAIPKQPQQTHYTDLDEAMRECENFALRAATQPQDCPTCTPRRVAP